MSRLLLRTLAGSRLYGTARPESDWDYYEVYDEIKPNQRKQDSLDVIKMPLAKWIDLCAKGTHQALDALWCPPEYAEVDEIPWLRWSVRVDPWRVADQLERTARALEHSRQSESKVGTTRQNGGEYMKYKAEQLPPTDPYKKRQRRLQAKIANNDTFSFYRCDGDDEWNDFSSAVRRNSSLVQVVDSLDGEGVTYLLSEGVSYSERVG